MRNDYIAAGGSAFGGPTRLTPAMAAWGVGIIAFAARYVLTGAIENDHFITMARALQVLHGDLPVRDFEDPGQPLAYLISTVTAAVFGPSLLVNVLLCLAFFAATCALTYLLAFRSSGSVALSLAGAALSIAIAPRLYNTTKVVVPVVAVWLGWRYADAPSPRRLAGLAFWSAVAFLLRHDYLAYVAIGNGVLLTLADLPARRPRALAAYVLLTAIFIAPWLLYVEHYEGIAEYFASAVRFVAAEGRRTGAGSFTAGSYALLAIPIVGVVASFRAGARVNRAQLASASMLLLAMDAVFLRDVLATRLPDVVAPSVIIAAATAGHLLADRVVVRVGMIAIAGVVVGGTIDAARVAIARPASMNVVQRVGEVTTRLRRASPQIIPNPSLSPLIDYVARCTQPQERVLVVGFGPEVPVLAHRPFAAGLPTWIPGYYEDAADVSRAVVRLQREELGAVILLDGRNAFTQSWPLLAAAVRARGVDEYGIPSIDERLRVWLPHAAAVAPMDPTGLPCPAR